MQIWRSEVVGEMAAVASPNPHGLGELPEDQE